MSFKVFDVYADKYDLWYLRNPVIFRCEADAIRSLNLKGKGVSLGVGTGILDLSAPIQVGIEPSLKMLKIASKRSIEPIRAVAEFLPIRDKSFDFVLMVATLCFLSSPDKSLKEAKRIIRSGGHLAICFIPRDSTWGKEYTRKAMEGHILYSKARFYTFTEVKKMLNRLSLQIVDVKATLSFSPEDSPKKEIPSKDPRNKGFVCIKAKKV